MLLAELVSWGFLSPCDFLCTSKGWGFGCIRDSNGRACKFGVNCNASVIDSLVCGVLTPYKIRKRYLRELFIDKFLYNTLTSRDVPHFAIFLNDVQRAGNEPNYRVGTTFLTGHFKGYTVKLNPLDGVYYCDLRPAMSEDPLLKSQISKLDTLLVEDIWQFI